MTRRPCARCHELERERALLLARLDQALRAIDDGHTRLRALVPEPRLPEPPTPWFGPEDT